MKRIAKAALLILGALSVVASAIIVYQVENISRDEDQRWRLTHERHFEQDFKARR